ncbi:MAG: DUF433 domain-containing protein [Chloroflexi bacterium]|nr:DUF433 domain-containing protein [Chloroflexota bacterium]MBI4505086.1 DUF433 domain-containing protein [Chloroflexota bacterium]
MAIALAPRIVVDPAICFGKPIIEGTRVPVALVLGKLAGGMTPHAVADEYDLTLDDVQAALRYAADVVEGEEIRAVS